MSTASSSTSSVPSFYTSGGTTHLNGSELLSGLDTQSLIKALTLKTKSKITVQQQHQQRIKWKREMYREVESLMKTFSDTYFSYANSENNILSSNFFDSEDLVSSSSLVSATGAASDAGNVIINRISSLAKAASVGCGNHVSAENITSGDIRSSWTKSSVGGNSMTLTYAGIDYTLTLSNSVSLDSSADTETNLKTLAEGLNDQIRETSGLKGNVKFTVTDGNKLTLFSTDESSSVKISAYKADKDDETGKEFLNALGFHDGDSGTRLTSSDAINAGTDGAGGIIASKLFNQSITSPAYLNIKVDGTSYALSLSGMDLSSCTDANTAATKIKSQISKLIKNNESLNGKVNVTDSGGMINMTAASGHTFSITGGSSHLLDGLGITNSDDTYSFSGAVNKTILTTSYLGDTLAGSTVTFNLNGVKKTIAFNKTNESEFGSADGIASYLQQKLNTAYGSGKITVSNDSGKLKFTTADTTSVLQISSSSSNDVLGKNGALRIETGETNRTETSKTLKELSTELNVGLSSTYTDSDGQTIYTINVNGKDFSFTEDTELNTVLNTINNDTDAGVNVTYSQTTNQFRITADDTGSQGKILLSDKKGNLCQSLFGVDYSGISEIKSGSIATDGNGKFTTGTAESAYTFQIGSEPAQTITIAANQSFDSLKDMANAVQTTINNNSTLYGKVTVGYTDDGKLTFNTTDNTADASKLTLTHVSGGDSLQIGTSSQTTIINPDSSLSDLAAISNGFIFENGNGSYSIAGSSIQYTADTKLADIGYNGIQEGTDLTMDVSLNGSEHTITRSTNTTTLDGVTLTVTGKTAEGADPIKFTASNNVDDLYKKISDFVDAYNKIIDKANTYTSQTPYGLNADKGTNELYKPLTDDQKKDMKEDEIKKWNEKAKQGLLQNDNTLNSILSDMRSAVEETVSSVGLTLNEIGISVSSNYTDGGKLEISSKSTLENTLKSEPDRVSQLFTNTDGISSKIKKVLEKNIGMYGTSGALYSIAGSDKSIGADNSQLSKQISQYETTIKSLKTQLKTEQNRWLNKFTQMENKLNVLNSQYTYLMSMTSN